MNTCEIPAWKNLSQLRNQVGNPPWWRHHPARPLPRKHNWPQTILTLLAPFAKVKLWRTHQKCYAMRTFPNVLTFSGSWCIFLSLGIVCSTVWFENCLLSDVFLWPSLRNSRKTVEEHLKIGHDHFHPLYLQFTTHNHTTCRHFTTFRIAKCHQTNQETICRSVK
jgi:hypothetical protein